MKKALIFKESAGELSLAYALLNCFIAEWFITPLHNSTNPQKSIIKLS